MSHNDSIVEQVRAIREARAAKHNFDLDAIYADLKRREQESGAVFSNESLKRPVQREANTRGYSA
ncbi:MAG TPA: hypothetical protein VHZ24_05695 [Pirellulales bacterium]|nr:hypothetical protein [Pirellulales bacterium]